MTVLLAHAVLCSLAGVAVIARQHRRNAAPMLASQLIRDARQTVESAALEALTVAGSEPSHVLQARALADWLTVEQAHAELTEEALGEARVTALGDDAYPDHVSGALRYARAVVG